MLGAEIFERAATIRLVIEIKGGITMLIGQLRFKCPVKTPNPHRRARGSNVIDRYDIPSVMSYR